MKSFLNLSFSLTTSAILLACAQSPEPGYQLDSNNCSDEFINEFNEIIRDFKRAATLRDLDAIENRAERFAETYGGVNCRAAIPDSDGFHAGSTSMIDADAEAARWKSGIAEIRSRVAQVTNSEKKSSLDQPAELDLFPKETPVPASAPDTSDTCADFQERKEKIASVEKELEEFGLKFRFEEDRPQWGVGYDRNQHVIRRLVVRVPSRPGSFDEWTSVKAHALDYVKLIESIRLDCKVRLTAEDFETYGLKISLTHSAIFSMSDEFLGAVIKQVEANLESQGLSLRRLVVHKLSEPSRFASENVFLLSTRNAELKNLDFKSEELLMSLAAYVSLLAIAKEEIEALNKTVAGTARIENYSVDAFGKRNRDFSFDSITQMFVGSKYKVLEDLAIGMGAGNLSVKDLIASPAKKKLNDLEAQAMEALEAHGVKLIQVNGRLEVDQAFSAAFVEDNQGAEINYSNASLLLGNLGDINVELIELAQSDTLGDSNRAADLSKRAEDLKRLKRFFEQRSSDRLNFSSFGGYR